MWRMVIIKQIKLKLLTSNPFNRSILLIAKIVGFLTNRGSYFSISTFNKATVSKGDLKDYYR